VPEYVPFFTSKNYRFQMRYKVLGVLLLLIFAFNLYAIITDFVRQKGREPFYYYGLILASLVVGIYFLFFRKR